ncbi:hypothetical protein [uncultured Winogradskyella sp.]|uniref:hypothetical protein n=1 Tax=uncultured Winogradskyella sp. TaxID=395353 RepID=UPI0026228666|nr:hypothetical protein [uncultured Winogradskyella sp.]
MNNLLTGKCKEAFKNWAIKQNYLEISLGVLSLRNGMILTSFYQLPFSMQYGVYVDFFDEQGIGVDIEAITSKLYNFSVHHWKIEHFTSNQIYRTRPEARKQAIIKANLIFIENHG